MEAARRHSGLPPPGPVLRPPPGASTLTRTPTHELPLVLAPPPLLKQAVGDENHPAPAEDGSAPLSAVTDLDG